MSRYTYLSHGEPLANEYGEIYLARAERTCYIDETHYDEQWESRYWVLSCGHCIWGEVPTNFCPWCGARVIK